MAVAKRKEPGGKERPGSGNSVRPPSQIKIRRGVATSAQPWLPRLVLSGVSDVCAIHGIRRGKIAIASDGRITFKRIAADAHQQLRNVIVNNF